MWNDLCKEEPLIYLGITCIRQSLENAVLIWKTIWLGSCSMQGVRAGRSVRTVEGNTPARPKREGRAIWGPGREAGSSFL